MTSSETTFNDEELIARLRSGDTILAEHYMDEAADRIEELTAKLAENEVRLRKAMEALHMLVRDCEADYPPSHGAIKHFAIATLAEISSHNKGESRDVPDR